MSNTTEYVIINKTVIQNRIDNLDLIITDGKPSAKDFIKLKLLGEILSESIPLIPELEKSWEHGHTRGYNLACCEGVDSECLTPNKKDYISNLKLDI